MHSETLKFENERCSVLEGQSLGKHWAKNTSGIMVIITWGKRKQKNTLKKTQQGKQCMKTAKTYTRL